MSYLSKENLPNDLPVYVHIMDEVYAPVIRQEVVLYLPGDETVTDDDPENVKRYPDAQRVILLHVAPEYYF